MNGVAFDFNRASLRPDSLPALVAARDAILTLGGDWQIAAHTDDRGSRDYNQALSDHRAMAVRDWLVVAGVDAARLNAAGFGYDSPVADNATEAGRAQNRRIALHRTDTSAPQGSAGQDEADPCAPPLAADTPPPPPIREWTGSGGLDWLPFSYLTATGANGGRDRLSMPPGTQPHACQALCAARSDCAAFSFEPAGASFIETATCDLIGYGNETDLRRDNAYLAGGAYHASGLKPDAVSLTDQSAAVAQSLLTDLADIAALRGAVRITAPDTHGPDRWMDVAVAGAAPADSYPSYLEITTRGVYDFDNQKSKSSLSVSDMADGHSGRIRVPGPGDYVLRYVIDHPTASLHVITEQPLTVTADDAAANVVEADASASLSFPMVVTPGETIRVTYSGPLLAGDRIDIVAAGDDDMSGGLGWGWATGAPVTLTAPAREGEYALRYVAENTQTGRVVLARDTLVVRAPVDPVVASAEILHRCDGPGLTPCDIVLPEDDIAITLLPGYGLTEPYIYVTPAGAAAARPSFDVVRIVDGDVVVAVNARQAQAVYCQDGLAGDTMCVTDAVTDADAVAVAFVLASLGSAAMALELDAMGEDAPGTAAGELQGVWFARLDTPGLPDHATPFIMMELFQDAGAPEVFGYFVSAPDLGPVRDMTGDVTGQVDDTTLSLTLASVDGTPLLQFTGTPTADVEYVGEVIPVGGGAAVGASLSRIAGPGEDWSGPLWMTGEAEDVTDALPDGHAAPDALRGDPQAEDRAMADLLGALIETMAKDGIAPAASPTLAPLGAQSLDLQGIPADVLIDLIVPFQKRAP
ncbi:OmpA family protein [Yoonia vestfoldensis]|uniref:OmpA family protein n=1 Tax=Yoonia vestfoldensis TaxID=245188 RepID=UPI00036B7FF2|nr:OmpA family protein [Yoonia vestfoldensis]